MTLVMPKQTGTLKALNASLKILYNKRTQEFVTNDEFKKLIAKELDFSKDKQDGAKLVKQSEMARYFGLSGFYKKNFDKKQKILPPGIKFYEGDKKTKISIIFNQLKKISFGKNSAAVKTSDSIIDPPKLFLKAIYELNNLSIKEFLILVFRTHGQKKTFKESIFEIISCRENQKKLPSLPKEYEKFNDPKFNVFLTELGIINKIKDKYYLSFNTKENYLSEISNLSIYNDTKGLDQRYISEEENINEKFDFHYHNKEILNKLNNRKPKLEENSRTRYFTDRRIKETVFKNNDYKCFFDKSHTTFLRINGTQFMEGHHIIPMNSQKDFKNSNIDREENILCVCPNCHRKIHLSSKDERKQLLKIVYEAKKKDFSNAKLNISFDDLYKKYYSGNQGFDLSELKNQTEIKNALLIEKIIDDRVKKDKIGATEEEVDLLKKHLIKEYIVD